MYKHPELKNTKHKPTKFHEQWGMDKHDFAKSEGTTPDAITQRLRRFGTPFQRRREPTLYEIFYNKTQQQLAQELDVHPSVISIRMHKDKCVYTEPSNHCKHLHKGYDDYCERWMNNKKQAFLRSKTWLHPDHPEYNTWRSEWLQRTLQDPKWAGIDYVPIQE